MNAPRTSVDGSLRVVGPGAWRASPGSACRTEAAVVLARSALNAFNREWAYTGFIANDLAINAIEQGSLEPALDWSAQSIADDVVVTWRSRG